ncbi:hypothetical protein [Celeribacter marinus]|uniref:hypothetical protein n=1 Tax=Celeribacter marinus TaxID=1397108 RepID=UPI000784F85D|nr:hypothetical protein [Celeribacter marinus]SFK96155.1 hypothetical protein SAMN05444421_111128 [Celeribacter marinus]
MSFYPLNETEILGSQSGISAKNPKSGILAKSVIWLFSFCFRGLSVSLRISDASFRNPDAILNNHIISMPYAGFQISEKAPLKGWVDSPARREVHHPPLGILLWPEFWAEINPTTAASTAKHQPPSSSTPSSPPEEETTHG